jgi:hypothetical protein
MRTSDQSRKYRHSLTYAVVTFRKVRCKSNFLQVRTEYMYGELYRRTSLNGISSLLKAHLAE